MNCNVKPVTFFDLLKQFFNQFVPIFYPFHPSYIRHEDFLLLLRHAQGTPPLKSETGWTGELWSNRVLLILEN